MTTKKFVVGDYVRLKAIVPCKDFPEGEPEERGRVIEVHDHHMVVRVHVPPNYTDAHNDDGLREVPITSDHVELIR